MQVSGIFCINRGIISYWELLRRYSMRIENIHYSIVYPTRWRVKWAQPIFPKPQYKLQSILHQRSCYKIWQHDFAPRNISSVSQLCLYAELSVVPLTFTNCKATNLITTNKGIFKYNILLITIIYSILSSRSHHSRIQILVHSGKQTKAAPKSLHWVSVVFNAFLVDP